MNPVTFAIAATEIGHCMIAGQQPKPSEIIYVQPKPSEIIYVQAHAVSKILHHDSTSRLLCQTHLTQLLCGLDGVIAHLGYNPGSSRSCVHSEDADLAEILQQIKSFRASH